MIPGALPGQKPAVAFGQLTVFAAGDPQLPAAAVGSLEGNVVGGAGGVVDSAAAGVVVMAADIGPLCHNYAFARKNRRVIVATPFHQAPDHDKKDHAENEQEKDLEQWRRSKEQAAEHTAE